MVGAVFIRGDVGARVPLGISRRHHPRLLTAWHSRPPSIIFPLLLYFLLPPRYLHVPNPR
jgi:hypothetical protein